MPAARNACRCCDVLAVDWPLARASSSTLRGACASRSSNSSRTGLANALPISAIASNSAFFASREPIRRYSIDRLNSCQACGRRDGVRHPVRMRRVAGGVLLLLVALALPACGHARPATPLALPASLPKPTSSHVVTIVMENREIGDVIGSHDGPYINRLARRDGLGTGSYGVQHPSLPDYLALTSGATHAIDSDCTS